MIEPSSGEQAGIEGGADSDVKYLSPATLIQPNVAHTLVNTHSVCSVEQV